MILDLDGDIFPSATRTTAPVICYLNGSGSRGYQGEVSAVLPDNWRLSND